MHFAHDVMVSLHGAAALVNSAPGCHPEVDRDSLSTTAEVIAFTQEWQWTGAVSGNANELSEVRALRTRLRGLWDATTETELADLINDLLREGSALPQMVEHDDFGWHIHATPSDAPLAVRMQVEAALATGDLLRAGERARLRHCAADDCDGVMVDFSRNRSRRYCDGGCGNRIAAAAYRARREV